MRRLMMVALVAGTAALAADVTPAAACGYGYGYGYGYGGCGCGYARYAPAYYYRPVYAYRPVAYAAYYRPRVWGWGYRGWGNRGWGYRGWGYGGWGRGWRRW
jgi:hypothetical protein